MEYNEYDPQKLIKTLRGLNDDDFVEIIIRGHKRFRLPDCACDICTGKFKNEQKSGNQGL